MINFGESGDLAAVVSGIWLQQSIKDKLKDNYGVSMLPKFTLDGELVQMSSFSGYKLIGVNRTTKNPTHAMMLAEWITDENNQLKRYNDRKMSPTNINASNNQVIKQDITLQALAKQNAVAVTQKYVSGSFWGPTEALGTILENKNFNKSIEEYYKEMIKQIES